MFGISGIELIVIALVALIVFGPKELPKAMRSAGATIQSFKRVSGEFRKQFEQALRDAEREMDIEETRRSVEAPFKDSPATSRATMQTNKRSGDSMSQPGQITSVSSEQGDTGVKKCEGNA